MSAFESTSQIHAIESVLECMENGKTILDAQTVEHLQVLVDKLPKIKTLLQERDDLAHAGWAMLSECERHVEASEGKEPVLRHQVEGWYALFSRICARTYQPSWFRFKKS